MFSFLKQSIKERTILVLTKPPKMVYNTLKSKIGNPKDYADIQKESGYTAACPKSKTAIPKAAMPQTESEKPEDNTKMLEQIIADADMEAVTDDGESIKMKPNEQFYTPIKCLSTFSYDWRIKVRLTKKGARKTYKNARSEGYFLHVELMDHHGTMIQATFFKDACDKFDPILNEGGMYLMSGGKVQLANQRYSTIKNDFCLVFDRSADIV